MLVQNPPGIIPGIEHHMVTGGGGARLHVVETGNSGGRPLVFLHGFSQSWLAWQRQMRSTWPTTTGWWRWTSAGTVGPTSPPRATPTPRSGPRTSPRCCAS